MNSLSPARTWYGSADMFGLKPWPHAAVAGYALTPSLLSQDSRVVPLVTAHTLRQYHAPVNAP